MSRDQDITPFQEYFISGIVILFFGLLYFYLSNGFDFGSDTKGTGLETASALPSASTNSSGLGIASALGLQVNDDKSDKETAKTTTSADTTAEEITGKEAAVVVAEQTAVENEQAVVEDEIPEQEAETEQLLQELAQQDLNVEPEPVEVQQPIEFVEQTPEQEAVAETEAVAEEPEELVYKLPDGTKVELATEGFEETFRQAILKGEAGKPIIFDRIYFESGSKELNAQSEYQIKSAAAILNTHPEVEVLIRGHSDNKGNAKKNSLLSLLRSGSMKKALVALGIDPKRVQIEGVGDGEPIDTNKTPRGRRNNRRVDLIIK